MQDARPRQEAPALVDEPPSQAVTAAIRAHTRALLLERMRNGLLLILASLTFFLLQDLVVYPELRSQLIAIKAIQIGLVFAVLLLMRADRIPGEGIVFGATITSVFAFFAAAAGILRGSVSGSALLFIAVTAGTAIGFPWGARAQAAVVAVCAALLAWNDYAIHHTLVSVLASPATGAMFTAGIVSVFVAHAVERYRWQIEARETGLRLREERFRSLIENGGDLILSVSEDGRILYVGPSIARLLGYDVDACASLFALVHPDDAARLREAMQRCQPGNGVSNVEIRLRTVAGEWRTFDAALANLRDNAAVGGFVLNARDITDRRQMEADLRRNQAELTHVLRLGTIGEIASALAHEINQPLAAITNYASTCARWLDAGRTATADHRHGLDLIAAEALRAGRIVHNLRDLSRKRDVGLSLVDLNEVVRRAAELVAPQARQQGISLRLETIELPAVCADAIQIEQVVLNLLLNAFESMQATAAKVLTVSTSLARGGVEVCVRDTGSGFAEELGERVFEPFFTTKPTGLGMGLAISRRIIEAHGGELGGGANADGTGCTFRFALPLPAPKTEIARSADAEI